MAFREKRLPDAVARGSRGGPTWKTQVVALNSGREQKNGAWDSPLHRYDISFGIKTLEHFEEVRAFHYVMRGRLHGFRMKDWNDYKATQANTSLELISGTSWQLQRLYEVDDLSYVRDISKPVSSPTPVIYRTRSGSTNSIAASVDSTTGIATISGHQGGDTYTWVGEFDVPVAFLDDAMDQITLDGVAGKELQGLPSILLLETREIA